MTALYQAATDVSYAVSGEHPDDTHQAPRVSPNAATDLESWQIRATGVRDHSATRLARDSQRNPGDRDSGQHRNGGLRSPRRQHEFKQRCWVADSRLEWTEWTVPSADDEGCAFNHERADSCHRSRPRRPLIPHTQT